MVASDNRGYTKEAKASGGGQSSFAAIPKGLNGVEDRDLIQSKIALPKIQPEAIALGLAEHPHKFRSCC